MSGSISYDGVGKSLIVLVENRAPYAGDVFTAVGLWNLPSGLTPTATADDLASWGVQLPSYNGINGDLPQSYAVKTNGIGTGFGEDATMHQFTFTFNSLSVAQLSAFEGVVGVGIHAQGGPGCSTKMGVQQSGVYQNQNLTNYANCRDVSVPEPGSMALLATGLAGMAFIGRRRRANLVDENGDGIAA